MPRRIETPTGMTRRHFLGHLAATSLVPAAMHFTGLLKLHAADLKRRNKACILLWMGGGPSTLDTWDPKPGTETGGPFQAISTTGSMQISEHLPQMARQMEHLSIVRSMSTREADHNRGRYYMHTGYIPNPTVQHPTFGSVVSHELGSGAVDLALPSFVSVGGASEGPGFLGMANAPFVVPPSGRINNLELPGVVPQPRFQRRLAMLDLVERRFAGEGRGQVASDHREVYEKTVELMTSKQLEAFRTNLEPEWVQERYGRDNFGRGCLMARRLVEAGVSFVEVNLGGWDTHSNNFDALENRLLPTLDRGMSALVEDLNQRGRLDDTAVVWMGEFGRTPRINANVGRDHWPRSWSVVLGGAGMPGGLAVGATDEKGVELASDPYTAQDLIATLCTALGIPLTRVYTSRRGRPMKVANGGTPIGELVG